MSQSQAFRDIGKKDVLILALNEGETTLQILFIYLLWIMILNMTSRKGKKKKERKSFIRHIPRIFILIY